MLKTWIMPSVINRQVLVALEIQFAYFVDLRKSVLVLQLLDSEIYKNWISSDILLSFFLLN